MMRKVLERQMPPLLSAIVSTYNSEHFIRGCLEDLVAQTLFDRMEVIVVDSGSQQNEQAIVREFQERHPQIIYIRTEERESLYAAWNHGIQAASGKYLTNANTDDRHRVDAFERMVEILEATPEVALVYADVLVTETENETFADCHPITRYSWFEWDRQRLLFHGCFIGPQPMWRRSLHDEYGLFDDSFVSSGDYEFWLRASQTNDFLYIPEALGLYLKSPTSIEHANSERQAIENRRILEMYQDAHAVGTLVRRHYADDPNQLLSVHNRKAELLFERGELRPARIILEQVVAKRPDLVEAWSNLGVICFHLKDYSRAIACFEHILGLDPAHPEVRENLAQCYLAQGDLEEARHWTGRLQEAGGDGKQPLVTAIVSTYKSEAFITGCLEDLAAQTIADRLEIIVIDSASPQDERHVVADFQQRYDNIKYVRTAERETVYQAWNRAIRMASGQYVTNANTDDRHRPDAFERMVEALEADSDLMVVYADQYVTDQPYLSFGECRKIDAFDRPDFHRDLMLTGCHMGSQPMWRKRVHDEIGFFDERFTSASDYEFWCRVALRFPMRHLPEKLGVYYRNPNGIEISNLSLSMRETDMIKAMYASLFEAPVEAFRLGADRRYKFLLPVLDRSQAPFMEEAVRAYLSAFSAHDPVLLVIWLSTAGDLALLEAIVASACHELGLAPEALFGDIEVLVSETDNARLPEAILDASEALLTPKGQLETVVRLAQSRDLPVLHDASADNLREFARGWNPDAIDIVLLTHNRLSYLEQTVEALYARTSHAFRLLIVDNASDAEVQEYLSANRDRFHRIIRNPVNRWTQAFTQGIALTRSDPFIVSDPDIVVPDMRPCWLSRMLTLMSDHPEMGMVALNLDPSNKPEKLPDVYVSEKSPHGSDLTLSYVGTVMQTIRRSFYLPPYTTDWHAVEAIRGRGGMVGFANHLVAYHLGWNEDRDYPDHLVKKHQHFNDVYGSNLYKLYTQENGILRAMDGLEPERETALTSIVMLTWNQVAFTQLCIESLYKHTPQPFELIIVDNGSTDSTVPYLKELATEHSNIKLILNGTNRGFAGGCNQGIAAATGSYVVLLNNDTVVSEGWLEGLIQASQVEGVGIVGPRTNCIVGPQQVAAIAYDPQTLHGFEAFAQEWRARNRTVWPSARVIGFCMFIRREVIDQIGGLDTTFGTGNFEDDDYCLRAQVAGFAIAVTDAVFIHHFGSVTFTGQKVDYRRTMDTNWALFKRKWGLPESQPLEEGYRHAELLAQAFDPVRHTTPLFAAEVTPAELPDRRGYNVLLADDGPGLLRALKAYLEAFREGDDVALHILARQDLGRVETQIMDVLAELSLDPERIPDISLLEAPSSLLELPSYLQAADLVLGSREIAAGARDMGIPAFSEPDAELLRIAQSDFRAYDWSERPHPVAGTKDVWMVGEDWAEALAAYLKAVEPGMDVSLLLRVPPGTVEETEEAITQWLLEHGHDPEQIPDVVLNDHPSEIGVYRLATAWIDTGAPTARAIAQALGIPVMAPHEMVDARHSILPMPRR